MYNNFIVRYFYLHTNFQMIVRYMWKQCPTMDVEGTFFELKWEELNSNVYILVLLMVWKSKNVLCVVDIILWGPHRWTFFKKIIKTIQSSTESSLIIIIIILWLRSSRPQVSSIDGCLEPSPTADCHLADYQDPPEPKKPSFNSVNF